MGNQLALEDEETIRKRHAKFNEAYDKVNHENERNALASNTKLKRARMCEFIHQIAEFKTLDPEIRDVKWIVSFFELLRKIHGRDGKGKGFWANRNTLWNKLDKLELLVIDIDYMKSCYRNGDLFLDSIVDPQEYEPYIIDKQYIYLGWFTIEKVKNQKYKYAIDYFDTFLRGCNIGVAMLEKYCYLRRVNVYDIFPRGVIESSNSYWAKMEALWTFFSFDDEADLAIYLEEQKYNDAWGFVEELKKNKIDIVTSWKLDSPDEEDATSSSSEDEGHVDKKAKTQ